MKKRIAHEFTTIKVFAETRKKLRLISAFTDRTIAQIVDSLVLKEFERVQKEQKVRE